jgi:hypothetical protein
MNEDPDQALLKERLLNGSIYGYLTNTQYGAQVQVRDVKENLRLHAKAGKAAEIE